MHQRICKTELMSPWVHWRRRGVQHRTPSTHHPACRDQTPLWRSNTRTNRLKIWHHPIQPSNSTTINSIIVLRGFHESASWFCISPLWPQEHLHAIAVLETQHHKKTPYQDVFRHTIQGSKKQKKSGITTLRGRSAILFSLISKFHALRDRSIQVLSTLKKIFRPNI